MCLCAAERPSSRVFMRVHSCMRACEKISALLSFTGDVCLLIVNAHRYLAHSDTNPPTLTHTYTHSSSQCDELSVPVRLGILVSTRFGSAFRGTELRTFSPSVFQRAANKNERQTGSESQGPFMISESLCLIMC